MATKTRKKAVKKKPAKKKAVKKRAIVGEKAWSPFMTIEPLKDRSGQIKVGDMLRAVGGKTLLGIAMSDVEKDGTVPVLVGGVRGNGISCTMSVGSEDGCVERYVPEEDVKVASNDRTYVVPRPDPDDMTRPTYYSKVSGGDCLAVINELDLPFALGNVMKYLWRCGKKNGEPETKELKKAREYLDRYIAFLEDAEEMAREADLWDGCSGDGLDDYPEDDD